MYEISCILDNKKYVGKASDPYKRFAGHLREARNVKKNSTIKRNWIQSRGIENMRLTIVAGPYETANEAFSEEKKMIAHYRSLGVELTNDPSTEGGENPPSHLGKKRSVETVLKLRAAVKAAMWRPEVRELYIHSHVGKKRSAESVERMKKSLTGKNILNSLEEIWDFLISARNIRKSTLKMFVKAKKSKESKGRK